MSNEQKAEICADMEGWCFRCCIALMLQPLLTFSLSSVLYLASSLPSPYHSQLHNGETAHVLISSLSID